MDRNQAKEFYPILQAFAEGRVIECRTKPSLVEGTDVPNEWQEMKVIEFWGNIEYRIKPEPKFRPFNNKEECWAEMQKHQPFGWYKDKDGDFFMVSAVSNQGLRSLQAMFENCDTFIDGFPFGVKVEE